MSAEVKGLELARNFYALCRPVLWAEIPDLMQRAAAGLVGEGSECFGLDDQFSRDHDFGPAFCVWFPEEILQTQSDIIERAFAKLPDCFAGMPSRMQAQPSNGRVGPLSIEQFYGFFTGLAQAPKDNKDWLKMRETHLAAATNGDVFEDNAGLFSAWRDCLLEYYPKDVWLKKLVAKIMNMAQAGQYNYPRILQRGDWPAAMLALGNFADAALGLVFLLNRRYMPYYKWAPKICRQLPILGSELDKLMETLTSQPLRGEFANRMTEEIELFCCKCANILREKKLSREKSAWLWAHGPEIMALVSDEDILRSNLLEA